MKQNSEVQKRGKARTVDECQMCGSEQFLGAEGFDSKAGPEVFAFLGLETTRSTWSICMNCGFLFQNPRAHSKKISELYSSGLYRSKRDYAEWFYQSRYDLPIDHIAWFASRVEIEPGAGILDIGAGHGGAVRAFQDSGYDARGIEIDPDLCLEAKERFGVDLIDSDISSVDIEPESLDLVYSAHTHEHFDEWSPVNERIYNWLKPGGCLLVVVPTYWRSGKNGQGFINVFHNSMFTKSSLFNMFVGSGFAPVAVSYAKHRPEVWGIGRKEGEVSLPAMRRENPHLVKYGVRWSPVIVQGLRAVPSFFRRLAYRVFRPSPAR